MSSPGSFTPGPLRTVREPLDSYGSNYPALGAWFCPLVPPLLTRLTAVQNWIIQSLRSTPITDASSLLRIVPPLHIASILSSLRVHRLDFSLNINEQVPTFHREACAKFTPTLCRSPSGQYTGSLPDSSQVTNSPWFWWHHQGFDTSTLVQFYSSP